jgi:hypothetical protein
MSVVFFPCFFVVRAFRASLFVLLGERGLFQGEAVCYTSGAGRAHKITKTDEDL